MSEAKQILTPVGRIVAGDCFKGQDKDADGNPRTIKSGPNAGQPTKQYFVALAIAKSDAAWPALEAQIKAAAREGHPTQFGPDGNPLRPDFAFKIVDGDSQVPNMKGTKPCDKAGYAGHWVLSFSSNFAPECYTKGGAERITDPSMIKRGYYVRIAGSVKGNDSTSKPGVYLNHNMIELCGHGDEINSGPDASSVFGEAAVLPTGASATPLAPTTPPPVAAASAPAPAVEPAHDFLNGPAASAPAPAPAPSVAPVVAKRLYNGVAYTEAVLAASEHTPEMIASYPLA